MSYLYNYNTLENYVFNEYPIFEPFQSNNQNIPSQNNVINNLNNINNTVSNKISTLLTKTTTKQDTINTNNTNNINNTSDDFVMGQKGTGEQKFNSQGQGQPNKKNTTWSNYNPIYWNNLYYYPYIKDNIVYYPSIRNNNIYYYPQNSINNCFCVDEDLQETVCYEDNTVCGKCIPITQCNQCNNNYYNTCNNVYS